MFWFMLIALVAVVAAVALAVLGDGGALKDVPPERIEDRLPPDRPLSRADIDAVRLPVGLRGYRMVDVDEVLDRLGAELAERDARITALEARLSSVPAGAHRYDAPGAPHSAPGSPLGLSPYGYGYGQDSGYDAQPPRPGDRAQEGRPDAGGRPASGEPGTDDGRADAGE